MKKKLLAIPSWYPTDKNRFIGNNYPLQLLLTENKFESFVLYGNARFIGLIKSILIFLKKKYKTFKIQTPPNGEGFFYPQLKPFKRLAEYSYINLFIEKINRKLMNKSYYYHYKKLINDNWQPDLIHGFSTVNGGIVSFYLSMMTGVPYVISEHQVFLLNQYSKYKVDIIRRSLIYANKVIAVSEHQKRQILMNYIACKPIVLGNFIDDELFVKKSKKNEIFTILTVTYDSFIKDNPTFFNAISGLIESEIKDFKVKIVGGNFDSCKMGGNENPLFKYLNEYNLTDYVELVGFVDKSEMNKYYQEADVFVSTSIAETFGMAQCEALMSGIPVISTSNGGIDDMLNPSNGVKVEIQNHKRITNAIIKIKNGEIKFTNEKIRNSVLNKYGRKSFSKKIIAIYNDAIQN